MKRARPLSGFTLLEVIVVLGLITLLAGALGLSFRDVEPARGLGSAQAAVAALVAAARNEAALHRNRVMLVVDADPADDRFLRGVQVAVETAPNSGSWWLTEHGILLERAIRVVPGITEVDGFSLAPTDPNPADWPALRRSSLVRVPDGSVAGGNRNGSGRYLGLVIPLPTGGLAGSGGGEKLLLAAARRTSGGIIFEHPDQLRGIVLSAYGVPLLINEAAGFDFQVPP
jgi:prepilin-type N-terminal cleavage/methylation domain-containing protein